MIVLLDQLCGFLPDPFLFFTMQPVLFRQAVIQTHTAFHPDGSAPDPDKQVLLLQLLQVVPYGHLTDFELLAQIMYKDLTVPVDPLKDTLPSLDGPPSCSCFHMTVQK
jgi:hypothetical protein